MPEKILGKTPRTDSQKILSRRDFLKVTSPLALLLAGCSPAIAQATVEAVINSGEPPVTIKKYSADNIDSKISFQIQNRYGKKPIDKYDFLFVSSDQPGQYELSDKDKSAKTVDFSLLDLDDGKTTLGIFYDETGHINISEITSVVKEVSQAGINTLIQYYYAGGELFLAMDYGEVFINPDNPPSQVDFKKIVEAQISKRQINYVSASNPSIKSGSNSIAWTVKDKSPNTQQYFSDISSSINVAYSIEYPGKPVPMIEVDGVQVPDPKISNPELFDIAKSDSPIVQFANAFGTKPEDVAAGLQAKIVTPTNGGHPFAVMKTSDNIALMMATQENGQWMWQRATWGNYWQAQNKLIGSYVRDSDIFRNRDIIRTNFSGGIFSLYGELNPITPFGVPGNNHVREVASEAHKDSMSMFYHLFLEPGKFPSDINVNNVDSWLNTRMDQMAAIVKINKTEGHPAYISFNEAWGETSGWNPEFNPLREKYGDNNWIGKYVAKLISKFVNSGLVPNKDFIVVFNDARLYNRPNKQDFIFDCLSKGRQDAFDELTADPTMKQKLSQGGINKMEDLHIILGSETYTKLGSNEDNVHFWPAPTLEQLKRLTEKFAPLGGPEEGAVILTEVNPYGTKEQKRKFLSMLSQALVKLPYLKGIIFWNIFKDSSGVGSNLLFTDPLLPFNLDTGDPTDINYSLLSIPNQ